LRGVPARKPRAGDRDGDYVPQLATLVEEAPQGDAWLHELKYDGYRIGCILSGGNARLVSRRGNDWTASFPELCEAAAALPARRALLDGEVAIVLPNGRTSFQALQNALSGSRRRALKYFVFDLLELDGNDLRKLALEERKAKLEKLLAGARGGVLVYSEHFVGDGPKVLERACELGAEGIVSKRRDQPYRPGRNRSWLKIKCMQRQELVIGGFTDPEGSRSGIGALLMGYYEEDRLVSAGKVGTGPGFTAKYLAAFRKQLEAVEQEQCPFVPRPPGWLGKHAHWLKPVLVGEVAFNEWTEGGSIRHGSFQGLRPDRRARDVVRERPQPVREAARPASAAAGSAVVVAGVAITTPERRIYPSFGFTKRDLVELYAEMGDRVLAYLGGRPLTLVRCEHGVTKSDALRSECRFLRHEPGWHRWARPSIRRVELVEQKKVGQYLVVDDVEGLLSVIQGDIVELHCWSSTADRPERPDRLIFDLDPGPEVGWKRVVRAALDLRARLLDVGLESFVKLTGGKGLHVVVPFEPEHSFEEAFEASRLLAETFAASDKSLLTTAFAKAARRGKILIDYKRNHRAAVAVAAYSTRALPVGSISMPVSWRELPDTSGSDAYTVSNVRARLRAQKRDPWAALYRTRQRLGRSARRPRAR
jgi:bifunctional non-homologous end joining protein LigD